MTLEEMVAHGAIVFASQETDIAVAWDGGIHFEVYAGKFDGDYDSIDSFYYEVQTLPAAKEAAKTWFQEHGTFNPGP